jgi:hypothetical protein
MRKKRKQNIQWDTTLHQVQQYNPDTTPKQLFAPSATLNPSFNPVLGQTTFVDQSTSVSQTPISTNHTPLLTGQSSPFLGQISPFLGQISPLPGQTSNLTNNVRRSQTSPSPFNNPQNNTSRKFRGGRFRGGRRDFSRRN